MARRSSMARRHEPGPGRAEAGRALALAPLATGHLQLGVPVEDNTHRPHRYLNIHQRAGPPPTSRPRDPATAAKPPRRSSSRMPEGPTT